MAVADGFDLMPGQHQARLVFLEEFVLVAGLAIIGVVVHSNFTLSRLLDKLKVRKLNRNRVVIPRP